MHNLVGVQAVDARLTRLVELMQAGQPLLKLQREGNSTTVLVAGSDGKKIEMLSGGLGALTGLLNLAGLTPGANSDRPGCIKLPDNAGTVEVTVVAGRTARERSWIRLRLVLALSADDLEMTEEAETREAPALILGPSPKAAATGAEKPEKKTKKKTKKK